MSLLLEEPLLRWESILSLEDHVVTDEVKIPASWQLRDEEEWLINDQHVFLIQLTRLWNWNVVAVDHLPELLGLAGALPSDDVGTVSGLATFDFDDVASFTDDFTVFELELLEPSCVSLVESEINRFSLAFNVP